MTQYLFVNLKRFDIPRALGGINAQCPPAQWGETLVRQSRAALAERPGVETVFFLPEAHLLPAADAAAGPGPAVAVGCQGVYRKDVAPGGNFGAFTTFRTAAAARALGCTWALIGHSEERADKLALTGDADAVDALLCDEVRCALAAGLKVLFCIGETAEEIPLREAVLRRQLRQGLPGVDGAPNIVLGYEPIWSIGPGKPVPTAEEVGRIAALIKGIVRLPVVYGGGLKAENAAAFGALPNLDGGLVGLTRFAGEIGFYPDEFAQIAAEYFDAKEEIA